MMKTLLLMRHAKSSWADAGQPDFERPLNERGRMAAPLMGRYLRRQAMQFDAVVCSPAARARETVALTLAAAQANCAVRYDARIYEASAARLLAVVNETPEPATALLLVGHNPGMEDFVRLLTGAQERMPTAAIACITINTDAWRKVQPRAGQLAWLVKPKELSPS
jgi:phosphohistidine phosphatase